MNIYQQIEFTQLSPNTTERDIIDFCLEAKKREVSSVCVNSCNVPLAKQLLHGSNVKITSTIGFPFGTSDTLSKIHEAKMAIKNGANEIDMVINIGLLKSKNYVSVLKDISDVKLAIGNTPLKVIIEISELNKNEIIKACQICMDANVDYIKTSSGFTKSGATLTVVKIIKKTVKNYLKICASGGIKDLESANKYLDIGVTKIGTRTEFKVNTTSV